MSELRIVRGNTFFTRSEVVAKTYDGEPIQDFDLGQATDIKVNVKTEYKTTVMEDFDIDGNNINIKWKGLSCGRYGLEVSGIYNGIEWRFFNRFVKYLCTRGIAASYWPLKDLVGQYVEVV